MTTTTTKVYAVEQYGEDFNPWMIKYFKSLKNAEKWFFDEIKYREESFNWQYDKSNEDLLPNEIYDYPMPSDTTCGIRLYEVNFED